uniref:Ribonuclease H2 subunit C n=1 Tax=Trichuris muris TaxID=70415 RepID=A0A5S6QYT4_TRIMR
MDTARVHSLPVKISYDGSARVETYFDSTRVRLEDGTETATFRGRPLNGVTACLPDNYRLFVTENTSKGDTVRLTALKEAQQFNVWSLDTNPEAAKVLKALTWLDVANDVFGS